MHINRKSKGDSATRHAKWAAAHAGQKREIKVRNEKGIAIPHIVDRFTRETPPSVHRSKRDYTANGKREVARRLARMAAPLAEAA